MSQSNAKTNVTLEIDSLSYGPYGIGRLDGKAVMIPNTAPGDTVEARITESKERYAIGEAIRIMRPSPARQSPPCPYVGACGGCTWQHVRYDAQLRAKQQSVEDALRRIGKLDGFDLRTIIPSPLEYNYRRRIRLQISPSGQFGYHAAASHQIVEIDSCLIADERLNDVMETLRRWLRHVRTSFRELEIISGDEPNQIVVVAYAVDRFLPSDEADCTGLVDENRAPHGLILIGDNGRKVWGQPAISVRLNDDLSLTVDADVFTQVNPEGNRVILDELLRLGDFQARDRVLELYCGSGNFTLPIARRSREIVAVEGDRSSIANGKLNAQKNGLENIHWICAQVPAALRQLQKRKEKFTKAILDPPRVGAKGIEAHLASLGANRIFYISCNPTTLARDLAGLAKHGYELTWIQPIDLFPQTFHVETLAIVERSKN